MVRTGLILAALALASCGSDEPSRDGNAGGGTGPGCLQSTCEDDLEGRIQSICVEDECRPAGPAGDDAGLMRAELVIYGRMPAVARQYALDAYSLSIFHEQAPDGGQLTCETLLALPVTQRRDAGWSNLVAWTTGDTPAIGDTMPAVAHGVPVTEQGRKHVALLEYFTGGRNEIPQGIIAQGCIEDLVVIEGEPEHPEDHRYTALIDIEMVGVAD